MKFSILIPVYNVKKYLIECMDSVMAQTYGDYEVILVDDGSTDGSGLICDEYALRYPDKIKVFHKENEGLLLTRRFSLQRANGEYIVFVDSDDYVAKELLSTLAEAFDEYECDMVIYNFNRFVDGKGEFLSPNIPYQSGVIFEGENKKELYQEYILNHTFVNMWIKAVKRSIVDIDADYRPWNVKRGEDIIQSFALFERANKIVFLDEKLYFYRKNSSSVTLSVSPQDYKSFLVHCEKTFQYLELWDMSNKVKKDFVARQMSRFYTYLRNIARKEKREEGSTMLSETVSALCNDVRFINIVNLYDTKNTSRRLRGRLSIMKKAVLRKRRNIICFLVKASNLFERKIN